MTPQSNDGTTDEPPRSAPWLGWLLPVGFLALAVVLYAGSGRTEIPTVAPASFDRASLIVGPRRTAMADPAHILVEGLAQSCNGCHQIFKPTQTPGATLNYHSEIRLSHGLNDRCVNCHDAANLERLTLRDGATIPFAETPQLCAQCHGTVYRDWQRGTHGKTLGSWMTGSEAQRRLSCNECHDPHAPKYEPYVPLPGPNTLRMGEQDAEPAHDGGGKESPLQQWLRSPDTGKQSHPDRHEGHP